MAASEQIANISISFLGLEGFSYRNNKNSFVKISLLVRGVVNQSGDDGLSGILKHHMVAGVSSS